MHTFQGLVLERYIILGESNLVSKECVLINDLQV